MAQTDWDFFSSNGTEWLGGIDGTPLLHTALSSPLTTEGTYCRRWFCNYAFGSDVLARIKAATYPDLVGVPSTKAISVRCRVRQELGTGGAADKYNGSFALSVKAASASVAPSSGVKVGKGYHAIVDGFDTASAPTLRLRCFGTVDAGETLALDVTGLGSLAGGVWSHLRMDVIPTSTIQDTIRLYTGTGDTGSETWTLVHTETILNSSDHYIAWDHATYKHTGFGIQCGAGVSRGADVMIDRYQAFLETV